MSYAIPDQANFDFGDAPVPDNFLDDTMKTAFTKHSRKESQMASVQAQFAKHIDQDKASNIASNLMNNATKETPENEIKKVSAVAVPDEANFDFGDAPIPDNFINDTMETAMTKHSRKESQIQSLQDNFAKHIDKNIASNIASNLIGDTSKETLGNESNKVTAIPDNFLDKSVITAMTQHSRKESQTNSLQKDFAKLLGQNAASNIAQSMMSFIHDDNSANTTPRNTSNVALDPDENDERIGYDEEKEEENEYGLDEMLIETVTAHKHRESRTDFVESKLHELFDENDIKTKGGVGGGVQDMSVIASNLVSFLHDDPPPTQPQKARGSTDLSILQNEIDRLHSKVNGLENDLKVRNDENMELNERINELEQNNHLLMKEIQFLQNSKTKLALQSTKCIDQMRDVLIQYQKCMKLKQ